MAFFGSALKAVIPMLEPAINAALAGDIMGVLNGLAQASLDGDALSKFISAGFKYGFLKYVANNTPMKKSVTLFGITIGV